MTKLEGEVKYSWDGERTEGVTIFPTHTCFDDALDYVEALIRQNAREVAANSGRLFVVHGICLKPEGTNHYGPWLEKYRRLCRGD